MPSALSVSRRHQEDCAQTKRLTLNHPDSMQGFECLLSAVHLERSETSRRQRKERSSRHAGLHHGHTEFRPCVAPCIYTIGSQTITQDSASSHPLSGSARRFRL